MPVVLLSSRHEIPWYRHFPDEEARWGNWTFIFNDNNRIYEYLVVFDDLHTKINLRCSRRNTIHIATEPPTIHRYDREFLNQFGLCLTIDPDSDHPNKIYSQPGLNWFLGWNPVSGSAPGALSFRQLESLFDETRSKLISVISSDKIFSDGHKLRLDFARKLKDDFGDDIDFYGHGLSPLADKLDALRGYRFHVVLENTRLPHYFSEKLSDCYIAGCFPIYYGCPNINAYFPAESLVPIDISDYPAAIDAIRRAIAGGIDLKLRDSLRVARDRVMYEHNLFALLARILDRHANGEFGTTQPVENRFGDLVPFSRPEFSRRSNSVSKARSPFDQNSNEAAATSETTSNRKKSDSPIVSVIVPIYGTEKYVQACITSIMAQSMGNIEILCVNDCSPDDSKQIVMGLQKIDPRIKLLSHESNLGLGGARNTGIKNASSEFICFVDSDDTVHPEMMEALYDRMAGDACDIVACGFSVVDKGGATLCDVVRDDASISGHRSESNLFRITNPAIWNKMIRKEVFLENNIYFPEKTFFEDLETMPKVLFKSRKIEIIGRPLYFHYDRQDSISNTFSDRHIIDSLRVLDGLKEFFIREGVYDDYKDAFADYAQSHFLNHVGKLRGAGKLSHKPAPDDASMQYIKYLVLACRSYIQDDDHLRQRISADGSDDVSRLFKNEQSLVARLFNEFPRALRRKHGRDTR